MRLSPGQTIIAKEEKLLREENSDKPKWATSASPSLVRFQFIDMSTRNNFPIETWTQQQGRAETIKAKELS